MDAVTYSETAVKRFVQEHFIPLMVPFDAKPLARDFHIKSTPTLIILGPDSREHHRTVGYLDPDDFIANGLLGSGKYHFDNSRYKEALASFKEVLALQPDGDSAAEAIFLKGVALFKKTGDRTPLKEIYEILQNRFPDSEWARKAEPYRLF